MVEIDDRLVDSISIHDEAFEVTDLVRTLGRHHVDGGMVSRAKPSRRTRRNWGTTSTD